MSVYDQVKQALQDIVAPELKSIQVEIKSFRSEMVSEIKRVDDRINLFPFFLEYIYI